MSFQIDCPNCGVRPVWEFRYGGPARPRPLGDGVTDRQWAEYLYNQPNPAGEQTEWWHHRAACKLWFQARRDTRTNRVRETQRFEGGAADG